jgi:hypothetical protein
VIVGEVRSVVAPDAEIAVVSSVPVEVLVVRISANPFVAAVGVCEGLAMMASVFVPVPAEITQGISHCQAQACATAGKDQVHNVVAVFVVRRIHPRKDVKGEPRGRAGRTPNMLESAIQTTRMVFWRSQLRSMAYPKA